MKKLVTLIMSVLIIMSMSACSLLSPSPKSVVENRLKLIKEMDTKTINEVMQFTEDGKIPPGFDDELMKLLVKNFSYKVLEATKNNDKATVKVEATNTDMSIVFGAAQNKLVEDVVKSASGPSKILNEEEMSRKAAQYIKDELKKEDLKTTTRTVELTLMSVKNKWELDPLQPALGELVFGTFNN